MTDVVEGTATELVEYAQPAPPTNLFHTSDPVEVIERATKIADALKNVLRAKGMVQGIQGKEYVKVEGWTTLGSMVGVVPVVEWTKPVEGGWEARVEARTMDGRTIGAAEAQCLRTEKMWRSRDDYALRSMAQTRATSKALRGPLGFIVHLAGYQATPAEEMDNAPRPQQPTAAPRRDTERAATAKQRGLILARAGDTGLDHGDLANVLLKVSGNEPREWNDPESARSWVNRALDRLPAKSVDAVLKGIEASA